MFSSLPDLSLLPNQAEELIQTSPNLIACLANVSALLYASLPDVNWCGFYLMDQGKLALGPFCGLPACVLIPLGKGVCGNAAAQDRVLRVPNVHQFPGHIACDSASNAEIVLPLHAQGRVIGVLDIDSPILDRFSETDEAMLLRIVRVIEKNGPSRPFFSLD